MNEVTIIGTVNTIPSYHHSYEEEKFYSSTLITARTSGVLDEIPVLISEYFLKEFEPYTPVEINGELRSYNQNGKVLLNVFVNVVSEAKYADEDSIVIEGHLCKEPRYRFTPKGREITDLLLAVNRRYGKTDYIPCVCWGANARKTQTFSCGDEVRVIGRIQSRTYEKEGIERITYEVSVYEIERLE